MFLLKYLRQLDYLVNLMYIIEKRMSIIYVYTFYIYNRSFKKEFVDFKQLFYDLKIQNDCCITGIDTSNINNENLGIYLKQVDDLWYKNFIEFLSKSNDVINDNETGLTEFKSSYSIITAV